MGARNSRWHNRGIKIIWNEYFANALLKTGVLKLKTAGY